MPPKRAPASEGDVPAAATSVDAVKPAVAVIGGGYLGSRIAAELGLCGCDVRIYDRWGQLVFRSVGYAQPWDGKNGGKDVPVGTYYYAIDFNDPQLVGMETVTGFISIIR